MLQGKQENVPPPRPSVKDRLGVPNPISSSKVLNALQPKASLALKSEAVEKVWMTMTCRDYPLLEWVIWFHVICSHLTGGNSQLMAV
jgi:hypothetical protein